MAQKSSDNKMTHRSAETSFCWKLADVQIASKNVDSSAAKSKQYSELARTGFHSTTEQITNMLKKLKKDCWD